MHSQLSIEVGKRVETMGIVEATLILTVAALYLAIVTGGYRDESTCAECPALRRSSQRA